MCKYHKLFFAAEPAAAIAFLLLPVYGPGKKNLEPAQKIRSQKLSVGWSLLYILPIPSYSCSLLTHCRLTSLVHKMS